LLNSSILSTSGPQGCWPHRDAAVTSLAPALSCRWCRPNAPFAELVRPSQKNIADEMREERPRRVHGD
jgi:hypothetical protein